MTTTQTQTPVVSGGAGRRRRTLLLVVGLVVLVTIGAAIAWQLDRHDVGRATGAEAADAFLVVVGPGHRCDVPPRR